MKTTIYFVTVYITGHCPVGLPPSTSNIRHWRASYTESKWKYKYELHDCAAPLGTRKTAAGRTAPWPRAGRRSDKNKIPSRLPTRAARAAAAGHRSKPAIEADASDEKKKHIKTERKMMMTIITMESPRPIVPRSSSVFLRKQRRRCLCKITNLVPTDFFFTWTVGTPGRPRGLSCCGQVKATGDARAVLAFPGIFPTGIKLTPRWIKIKIHTYGACFSGGGDGGGGSVRGGRSTLLFSKKNV